MAAGQHGNRGNKIPGRVLLDNYIKLARHDNLMYGARSRSRDRRRRSQGTGRRRLRPGQAQMDFPYPPGGRYLNVFTFAASSTSSGVSKTVVLIVTTPLALTVSAMAAMLALSGASAMT